MSSKFRLTFVALVIGLGTYFLYAAIVVPAFIMPRAVRQRVAAPRPTVSASREVERISRENSDLLAEVFPDPNDWRRLHPLSVIPKDRSWLLLFPSEPHTADGGMTFDSCTLVKPSSDKNLSEKERFRRAMVVETSDKVEIRFRNRLSLEALSGGFSADNVEGGRVFGKVSVWSTMDPNDPADDFRLTTRNISFNLEQITTDSEVIIHYGKKQAEGVGLRVNIELPLQKKGENDASEKGPLDDMIADGNLGQGISIRDVTLDKLTRLEFEMPDYLPTLPDVNPWDGAAAIDPGPEDETADDEKTPRVATFDVRCSDSLYFAPNVTDMPSVWCARFSGNVEISAFHEERQPDSIRCDYLYFYLNDPVLQKAWEKSASFYKGKRKPTGAFSRLEPFQIRAIGTPERKSALQIESGFFGAEGGEILCELDRGRITLQPLSGSAAVRTGPAAAPTDGEVALQYGKANVVSGRIELEYGDEALGRLTAYKNGRLEADLPTESPDKTAEHLSMTWNDLLQIAPVPNEADLYVASLRGALRAESTEFGILTADEADFWFKAPKAETAESADGKLPKAEPQSARLKGNVEMGTPRGTCRIRDELEIVFDQRTERETPSGAAGTPSAAETKAGNPFDADGSMLGVEGNTAFDLDAGKMKVWLAARPAKGYDVPAIRISDRFRLTEIDPAEKKETLRIDGSDVRIDNPGTERVSVVLRGAPANFVGSGLNLVGNDVRVSRPENKFSVNGNGRLQFAIPKNAEASAIGGGAVSGEPIDVWWPNGMTFDGRELIFQGKLQPQGGPTAQRPKDNEMVNVKQGDSLLLKSPLISLRLKQPIQIFDFDMGKDPSGAKQLPLDKTTCQGTPSAPVCVEWYGAAPAESNGGGADGGKKPLRGRGRGEVTYVELRADTGDFSANGPGWFRGTIETPAADAAAPSGGEGTLKDKMFSASRKPWTHFHLVFHDAIVGNIRTRRASVEGDVRLATVESESPRLDLDVNGVAQLPPGAFFLSCRQLAMSETSAPGDAERFMEVTALGDTRFEYQTDGPADQNPSDRHSKYQTFIGRADEIKYDHRKRTATMKGDGLSPATLSRQERIGAPVSTQTFNSASFNLDTEKLDVSLSGTGFSAGDVPGLFPGR